jgi:myo-inositol-1(or 4)-monophosphatase
MRRRMSPAPSTSPSPTNCSAAAEGGCDAERRPDRASAETDLGRALVATGFGYDADRRREHAAVIARIIGDVRDVRRIGSAAIDLCHVAAGRVDVYYEAHLNPWDGGRAS